MDRLCIIIGSTRTGVSLAVKLDAANIPVRLIDTGECHDRSVYDFYIPVNHLDGVLDIEGTAYFVTFDEDSKNVNMCLSIRSRHPDARIYTMFTQESLGKKLSTCISNFYYINPSKQAGKKFVNAALSDLNPGVEAKFEWPKIRFKPDSLVKAAILFISCIVVTSTTFFHFHDGLPWIDSFYFTITMMTTVGFGDYSLRDQSDLSKIFGSLIMILSVTSIAMIFALVSDSIIRRRKELTMGRSSYKGKNHVIVVGGGSVGLNVIEELLNLGEQPVVLDRTLDGRHTHEIVKLGVPHLVGDARDEHNLYRAGLGRCKALICVTENDLTNLEVGLDSKSARPDLRIVLRIYDINIANNIKTATGITHTMSMSSIAADEFFKMEKSKDASLEEKLNIIGT